MFPTSSSEVRKIKNDVADSLIQCGDKTLHYTVSIGLAKENDQSIDQVLDLADQELYKAKSDGRNNLKFRL